jgi:DNA polymerase III delta subunit
LDKLSLFVGKKTAIDMQDIKAHGLPDDMGNFRDFETAIWEKRLPDALRQGELMSEMGVRSEQVFPIIERVFRTVLLGHFYLQRKKWKMEDVYAEFRMRGKTQQGQLMTALRSYTPAQLERGFEQLVRADYEMKSGLIPNELTLSLFLVNSLR